MLAKNSDIRTLECHHSQKGPGYPGPFLYCIPYPYHGIIRALSTHPNVFKEFKMSREYNLFHKNDEHGNPDITVAYKILSFDYTGRFYNVAVGVAFKSPKDGPNRKVGNAIAIERLNCAIAKNFNNTRHGGLVRIHISPDESAKFCNYSDALWNYEDWRTFGGMVWDEVYNQIGLPIHRQNIPEHREAYIEYFLDTFGTVDDMEQYIRAELEDYFTSSEGHKRFLNIWKEFQVIQEGK